MECGRLQQKVALITGASQGIGKAIASLFIREGARVILSDIHDALGHQTVCEIGSPLCSYLHLNVRNESEWKFGIEMILEKFGSLDILVNNAGITGLEGNFGPQDPEYASLESWRVVHEINLDGLFLGCKYAIQAMKKSGRESSIINISSRSGLVGVPEAAAYASSKAAVRNHTKSVALYCCQKGYKIRCNSVHPAVIGTPMWEQMVGKDGSDIELKMAEIAADIPMKRIGSAEDVANAVLFFASEESRYSTGSELIVDGGLLAGSSVSPKKR